MGYSRNEIIEKCEQQILSVSDFYKADFINYRGRASDTGEYYTEIVAGFVYENLKEFQKIPMVTRESSYKVQGHDGEYSDTSNRLEEITAMKMFQQSKDGLTFDYIGKIIDYQTPLKNRKKDDVGKIDLLSVQGDSLLLLELKREDSLETMLRCVLEGFTYLKALNEDKLVQDFELEGIKRVCASPLVFKGMSQWKEMQEYRPKLVQLMRALTSKPYYISMQGDKFVITED